MAYTFQLTFLKKKKKKKRAADQILSRNVVSLVGGSCILQVRPLGPPPGGVHCYEGASKKSSPNFRKTLLFIHKSEPVLFRPLVKVFPPFFLKKKREKHKNKMFGLSYLILSAYFVVTPGKVKFSSSSSSSLSRRHEMTCFCFKRSEVATPRLYYTKREGKEVTILLVRNVFLSFK